MIDGKRVASSEYRSWQMMKNRCLNPRAQDWSYYGGRGIAIDPRWHSFDEFIKDMGPKPDSRLTLERKDSAGPYCKTNCEWATRKKQAMNRDYCRVKPESHRRIFLRWVAGERQADIAEDYGVTQSRISGFVRAQQ